MAPAGEVVRGEGHKGRRRPFLIGAFLASLVASASPNEAVENASSRDWRPRWLDFEDKEVTAGTAFDSCTAAVRAIRKQPEPREPTVERIVMPAVPATDRLPSGLRAPVFVFFVLISRPFADMTVSRQLYAAHAPRHLWLLHADLKTDAGAVERLRSATAPYGNVHLMARRHRVQWGGFSMVDALLDALATALYGVTGPGWRGFDFFINLSDTDLLLRTEPELSAFFAPFAAAARSFVGVKTKGSDPFRWEMHNELRKLTFAQCGGYGFAVLNATAADLFPQHRRCCYGRSGPILYGRVPFALPRLPEGASVLHGSQWVSLHASHAAALLRHPTAVAMVRGFRYTFLSDEAVVQTALMAAPELRRGLVNHNLRHIDWPHGYGNPEQYWREKGEEHEGGPIVLAASHARELFESEAISARKADPTIDGGRLFALWDAWMAHKKSLPAPSQAAIGYISYAHRPLATLRSATAGGGQPTGGEAEEGEVLHQPPIGASLLAVSADLSHARVPPGPGDLDALLAAGLPRAAAAAELEAREAALQRWVPHYGHVDNVTQYYLDYFEQARQHEAAQKAASLGLGRPVQQPQQPPPPQPQPQPRIQPLRVPPDDGTPSTPLASVQFADGVRCECGGPSCRARRTCCDEMLGQVGSTLCSLRRRQGTGAIEGGGGGGVGLSEELSTPTETVALDASGLITAAH